MSQAVITPETVIRRSDSILASNLENEVVMMDVESGSYYGLEEPASRIWDLLAEPKSVSDLVVALQSEYDITPEQCQHEVISFVEELKKRKVVDFSDI